MSKKIIIALVLVMAPAYAQKRNAPLMQPPQQDQTPQVILSNFANVAQSIIMMGCNPHNPQVLGVCGCNIVASLSNMVAQAFKLLKPEECTQDQIAKIVYERLIALNMQKLVTEHVVQRALLRKALLV